MERTQAEIQEWTVEYLVDRVFDSIDEACGLYDQIQAATFVEIKQHNPEAYEDWQRLVKAERSREMSIETFAESQNKFFDEVVDPYKNALMTRIFALCIQKLLDERVVQMAEATGYAS